MRSCIAATGGMAWKWASSARRDCSTCNGIVLSGTVCGEACGRHGDRPSWPHARSTATFPRPGWMLRHLAAPGGRTRGDPARSEEHTSELQSLMRISYAVFCLKKKKKKTKSQKR